MRAVGLDACRGKWLAVVLDEGRFDDARLASDAAALVTAGSGPRGRRPDTLSATATGRRRAVAPRRRRETRRASSNPASDRSETPTRPLPQLDEVEIVYSTTDRYVGESLEPDEKYAADVRGVVTGVILREEGDEVRGKGAGRARPRLCLY